MKLDYILKGLVVCFLFVISSPSAATAASGSLTGNKEARVVHLQNRLNEIKAQDKSRLSHSEKKILRKEVKEIKKELAAEGGGIYLSVGAILLIALLLILLL